jgi:hypothetical protein
MMHFSNPENQYFPDPVDVAAHASAFVQLMFVYTAFEAEIRSLQKAITKCQTFYENWTTKERPKRFETLVQKYPIGTLEAEKIKNILQESICPSHQRNFLVHGEWWCLNKQTSAITVRSDKKRCGEEQHRDIRAADIEKLVETFKTLEAELSKLRRQIEKTHDPDRFIEVIFQTEK